MRVCLCGRCVAGVRRLKKNIGMAYINEGHFKLGTKIKVEVRNKMSDGVVTKMPFVPARYYKP